MEDNIITRESVEKCDKIDLYDKDTENELDLFCYINCNNNENTIVKNCRGLVFHNDELILKGFPYTYEYTTDNYNNENEFLNYRCFKSYEGTLLRVFFYNKWYITTHRKLNAFKSKWCGNKSYGELFENALKYEYFNNKIFQEKVGINDSWEDNILPKFLNILDKEKQYMFLILNDKLNRIVCDASERVLHVGTFLKDKTLSLDIDCYIPHTEELKFDTLNNMLEYVEKIDITKNQGLILFSSDNYQYKIYNKRYFELLNVRSNVPSIKFRYLQLFNDHEKRSLLEKLYPDNIESFKEYDKILREMAKILYDEYIKRYIHKKYEIVSKEMHKILKDCHKDYIFSKQRMNLIKVEQVLSKQNAIILNHLIKNYKLEQKKSGEVKEPN